MTYLPLTRLIAAAGGVVLPLMAGEALAVPSAKTASSIESKVVTSMVDPHESIAPAIGETGGTSWAGRMEVDK